MHFSASKKVILISLLFAGALFISLPREIPIKISFRGLNIDKKITRKNLVFNLGKFKLEKKFDLVKGLDLEGGSHLVFVADTSKISQEKKKTALSGVRDVIEKRVNLFGVSEPNVQISSFEDKDRIIVELPGVRDTKSAIDIIGKTAQLVFAQVFETEGSQELEITDLTGADLKSASVTFDQAGKPVVSIEFTNEGSDKFTKLTDKNVGKALPILLDNQVVSAPVVQEKITGGSAQISGDFTIEDAKELSIQLNAGALPVPISLVDQRTVGASLGAESVVKSVNAGIIGIFMVLAFMILSYGKLGLVADLGLIIFGVVTLALYKLVPVVLTLPGIAGFLLSVGMAVDSNILIFERFKEEKDRHATISDALEVSFGRAWDSIRDANIATLVTAFILANPFDWSFLHTSGPVRGFAITLALGIGISLFTGIVVSRNLLRVFVRQKTTSN